MTRRSSYKSKDIPTITVRWRIPTQLKNDLAVVARVMQRNEGELVAWSLLGGMQRLVEWWNSTSTEIKIPSDLASLKQRNNPFETTTVREFLQDIERAGQWDENRRRK